MGPLLILILCLFGPALSTVTYEGYKVYTVTAVVEAHRQVLELLRNSSAVDFWSEINNVGQPITIMVSPSTQTYFESLLILNSIEHDILIDNVADIIQNEQKYHKVKPRIAKGGVAFDQYLRYDEINAYLVQLSNDYPDVVTVETIGQSYEGRDLVLVHIYAGAEANPENVIFIESGMHAREWIGPAVALYIISELVENPNNRNLIENVKYIIWPNVNPDGYDYTWNKDRFWRKTRTPGKRCDGVDGNRNFGFNWMRAGASSNECDEDYAGPEAFSEVETRAFRDFLLPVENIKLYLSLHSYGQYLIYPWSYTRDVPDNWKELDALGNAVNDAISAVDGTTYTVGSSTNVLYYAAGCSDDWVMGEKGVNLVFVLELPGGGRNGFDLPASKILKVAKETWQGFLVLHNYVVDQNN